MRLRWRHCRRRGARAPRNTLTVALVGNPNSGKTAVFNRLTGLSQRVGNYPGVTVERKEGWCRLGDLALRLVDLPGTYSLAAKSPDEEVAVDVLLGAQPGERKPDLVLEILDASSAERGLYLLSQVLETGIPVVVALTMVDVAEARGVRIDAARLSERIGAPVVPIEGHRGTGFDRLRAELERTAREAGARRGEIPGPALPLRAFRPAVETVLRELGAAVAGARGRPLDEVEALRATVDRGGRAERLLLEAVGERARAVLEAARASARFPEDPAAHEAEVRYGWIRERLAGCAARPRAAPASWSERVDRVLTHRVWGLAIFALLLLAVFEAVFAGARPAMEAMELGISALRAAVEAAVSPGALRSLLSDGVIAGVGMVVIFLPQILILFLAIGILEDVGYMARAAFLMDRLLRGFGLSGKSVVPMFCGFACAVPAILGARVIEDRKDRLVTMLVTPLLSCSARLPVYSLFIGAFIPPRPVVPGVLDLQGLALFSLYALGVAAAAAAAWVLRRSLLKGPRLAFLMELPSYKLPSARGVFIRLRARAAEFLARAGTVILAMAIFVWALAYFPRSPGIAREFEAERARVLQEFPAGGERDRALERLAKLESGRYLRESFFGRVGRAVEPVFAPLGWDWRVATSVLASFAAREVFVASLATVLEIEDDLDPHALSVREGLRQATKAPSGSAEPPEPLFTLPAAVSILVFFALACQCGGTVATLAREARSWLWALFLFAYMSALAYGGAFAASRIAAALGS